MVLLETIHAGVPIVASAAGGVPDLLPVGSALLVPPMIRWHSRRQSTKLELADPGAAGSVCWPRGSVAERFSPANGSVATWRCTSVSWSVALTDVR